MAEEGIIGVVDVRVRKYQKNDLVYIETLFYQTVHVVNAKDYTPAQLSVWATGKIDSQRWHETFSQHTTLVAMINEELVGFGDCDSSGYIDFLYVHKDYQRQGIATALLQKLEQQVASPTFETYASITARPFFEKQGYQVLRENQVERQGVSLRNYLMKKTVTI